MKTSIFVLFILFFLCGCNSSDLQQKEISKLKFYVERAISGDASANRLLSGIIDSELPAKTAYTNLFVDSMKLASGKKLYSVMIQFDNPLYNRLAIYDSRLNLLLGDESLNGNISLDYAKERGPYLKVVEGFLSKDFINLKRVSLYKLDTSSVNLAFRSFISLSKPDMFISQDIAHMDDEIIITNIAFPDRMIDCARQDTFIFHPLDNRYISKHQTFDSLVIKQVNSYTGPTFLPELVSDKTIRNMN